MEMHINWMVVIYFILKSTLWGIVTWIAYCLYPDVKEWISWHLWLKWKDLIGFIICYMLFDLIFGLYKSWL